MGGGASDATKQQQQVQLASSQQQLQFNNKLMNLFNEQYKDQKDILSYLQGQVKPIISQAEQGKGMSPAAEVAMRSQATDTISQEEQQAQQAVNQREVQQMGGTNVLPSGVNAQLDAALAARGAQQRSAAQLGITQFNQSLATSNLWNGLNVMEGNAAQMNPLGYAGSATSGGGVVAEGSSAQSNLQRAVTEANNSGFWHQLGSSFAGALGKSLGSFGFSTPSFSMGV